MSIIHFQGSTPFSVELQESAQGQLEALFAELDQQWHASLVVPEGEACTINIQVAPQEAKNGG